MTIAIILKMMVSMNLGGRGGIGVVVVTARSLPLLLVNLPLEGMMMVMVEANLEGRPSQNQRIETIVTWRTIIAIAVTHHTVLDHLEADLGVAQNIPTPLIRVVVLDQGHDLDRHLIRHHPPLQGVVMIENIVAMAVEDTAVEAGVAVEIEITTIGGDHNPMVVVVRGGATTIIIIMGGVEMIDEGGK
jgi:hypothetical protein